jgi:hypothetical protein
MTSSADSVFGAYHSGCFIKRGTVILKQVYDEANQ